MNRLLFLLGLFCSAIPNASAVPILWTISGGLFDDGGAVSGSFVFDADTTAFSSVNITTTAGTALPGVSYPDFAAGDASIFFLYTDPTVLGEVDPDFTGITILALGLTSPMTNVGGVIPFQTLGQGSELLCADAQCGQGDFRFIDGGEISSEAFTAVPEPSTMALVGIGLGALWFRRRRASLRAARQSDC